MKSLLVKFGIVLLIGLAIFGYAEVWGADWRLYDVDDENIRYYDAEGMIRPSKNIVRVWIRWEYTDKGVTEMVRRSGKEYENICKTVALEEINCLEKKWRNLSLTHYSKEGKVILSIDHESKWNYIVPDSRVELLHEKVCK